LSPVDPGDMRTRGLVSWRPRVDRQCVYSVWHPVPDGMIHEPMSGELAQSGKSGRDDSNPIVACSAGRAGMAGMQMTFVFHRQFGIGESLPQALFDFCQARTHGGGDQSCCT
jgi:hypothetical protein